MEPLGLTFALIVTLAIVTTIFNYLSARVGVVETTLNEGLPPGHGPTDAVVAPRSTAFDQQRAVQLLDVGLHLFLSRGCYACMRLLGELERTHLGVVEFTMRYVDRPRPIAHEVARFQQAELLANQHDLIETLGIDPLPHVIAIGPHGLVAHAATPTIHAVSEVARNAGLGWPAGDRSP